jgi:hypothetical protein
MKLVTLLGLLLFTATALAQQAQPSTPPFSTVPAYPPDTQAEPAQNPQESQPEMSNADVRHEIQSRLDLRREFADSRVVVDVDNDTVTLSGYVLDPRQRSLALAIADTYADGRKLVDNIESGFRPL